MCGIVAVASGPAGIDEDALRRATLRLEHRGPEAQRWWIAPHRRTGLGHARLGIIDLATGDQPIANEDGRLQIVVNGEFYGYEPIQRELERGGHRLRTRSDSEIALHLYGIWRTTSRTRCGTRRRSASTRTGSPSSC
jgi:asparagine synthase (glutamine-hydrolysing)